MTAELLCDTHIDALTTRYEQAEKLGKMSVKIRQKTARQKGHMVSVLH